jgi:hypothetical protein
MKSFSELSKKYGLDDFESELRLKGHQKVDFYNDLLNVLSTICRLFDMLSTTFSLRADQVLMSLAKLQNTEEIITKTDIMNSLDLDRREKLLHAFDTLKDLNLIKIHKKTSKLHLVKLNEEDNPDLNLFREIVERFWISPQEEKEKIKRWREGNE